MSCLKRFVAVVSVGLALSCPAAYRKGELIWQTEFAADELPALNGPAKQKLVEGRTWRAADGRNGDGAVYVRNTTTAGDFKFGIPLKPDMVKGLVFIEADVKGVDLGRGPRPFNGPKVMIPWRAADGRTNYPQCPSEFGSFDWKTWVMVLDLPQDLQSISVVVGLENAPGEFWVDNVRVYRAVEIPDDAVAAAPPNPKADALPRGRFAGCPSPACYRGVMSGNDLSEAAFKTLHAWHANLIRFQIGIRTHDCADDAAWFARLDRKLDEMEAVLKLCRTYGLKLVVDLHGGPGTKQTKYASNVVPNDYDTTNLRKAWRIIATRFREDPAIYGYDILNEPATSPATWDRVFREVVAEIRTVDTKTPVITESFKYYYPNENVIYSPHYYSPHTLTHMGVGGGRAVRWSYNNWINGEFWNKDRIREALAPFILFQRKHPEARIYVGEFSCILWAKGAAAYINDCIELFDEYGWDWTYHAFREWPPWSVEYEHAPDYALGKMHKATQDTDRKRALLKGLRNNVPRVRDAEETALGGFGGSLEFPGPELLFQPCYKPNNWTTRVSLEDGFTAPVKGSHAFYFMPDADKPKERVYGTATFVPTSDGGVEADWSLQKGDSTVRATVCTDFRLPQYEGALLETDAGSLTLTEAAAFGQAFDKDVRRLTVKDATGALKVRLEFPEPVRVRLFKERDWGLVKFALNLFFRERPNGHGLAFKAFAAGRIAFREEGPQTIVAGKDWIPFQAAFDVEAGSALDFSGFRGTDAPAGKNGRVIAKDGRFEFEKRPGKAVRFYGINICSDANAPKPEDARAFAATLRKLGYNAIRFHHHEKSLVKGDPAQGSTELDPAYMERFDALVAACVENGIYLTTDLFVSREPISYRSIGIDRDGNVRMNEFKFLVQVHEGAYSNYVAFARNFLNHVNPHTGRRYADEPALALLSLVNEGNMSGVQWAGRTFGLLKEYSKETLADLEAKFARRMKKVLREEIGYRGLITNMNNYFWADDPPGEKVRAEEFDYSDDHFYVDHPRFVGQNWCLPSSCPNTNPLVGADKGTQRLASTRPWGLPFTITEYNFSGPGRFRGVGGILTGAMGARQDWGGLLRFAWSHGSYGLTHAKELGYFDMSGDPLGLAAERASICLFLRGDLAPADKSYVFLMPPGKVADTKKTPGSLAPYWATDWAAWNVRLGMCVADKAPAGVSTAAVYPEAPKADVLDALRREPTGGVRIDSKKGAFTLDTPRTAGGFAEGGVLTAGGLTVDLGTVPATVWASSLDGAPIATSRRLLLTHLTDVQNSGIRYADAGKRILLDWGKGPHLMRAGRADVSLACAKGTWQVWVLSPTGRRVREVAAACRDGRLSFTADVAADPANASYLYELVLR